MLRLQEYVDISTDEILPAGAEVLPYRSDVEAISQFAFQGVDEAYAKRCRQADTGDGHAVVGGENYGQGSSREHAALAPRFLGLRAVLACSYARIHLQNLVNYGVLPLLFADAGDRERLKKGDTLSLDNLRQSLADEQTFSVQHSDGDTLRVNSDLTERQREIILAGGLLNWMRENGNNSG